MARGRVEPVWGKQGSILPLAWPSVGAHASATDDSRVPSAGDQDERREMRRKDRIVIGLAAGTLLLAACGSDDAEEALDQLGDAIDEVEGQDEEDQDDQDDEAEVDMEPASVEGRAIDGVVHHGGLEYTITSMSVVDLDAENSPDGEVDQRVQGLELTFEANVTNPGSDTVMPSPSVSLQWDEPGTDNVVDVSGRAEFRQVPGDASSSGEFTVPVSPQDLEVYDDDTARLIIGQPGQSPAQLPVGDQAELIDRFPVLQDLEEDTFEVGDVTVTITAAEVRWDRGDGSHVEDDTALFELTYTMDNPDGSQSCSTRGEGAFALTLPNGEGIVDLGVTERCVRGGETERDVRTGFLIEGEYGGDYTLRHERGDEDDEITFTLVEGDGVSAEQRDTR